MIETFVTILRDAGVEDLTAMEVAEMILLASYLPTPQIAEAPESEAEGEKSEEAPPDQTSTQQPQTADQRLAPESADTQQRQGSLYDQTAEEIGQGEGVEVAPFRAPRGTALPGARKITRALRPLRRRFPSNRRFILDEEKTVRQIADGGPRSAVMKPAPERWLDVALVFDESMTMRVWRQTMAELLRLFEQCGVFRDIRAWTLDTGGDQAKLFRPIANGAAKETARRSSRSPRELLDPSGRRLIVIVSDCLSTVWHNGDAYRVIAEWATKGPVALLQTLPRRLWIGTTMTPVDAALRAPTPAVSNRLLQIAPRWYEDVIEQGGVALPVVTLDEWSIGPWARMIAGASGVTTMGLVIPRLSAAVEQEERVEPRQQNAQTQSEEIAAQIRIARFFESASPLAKQLVRYLASAPLSLPVMQLVQQTMLPESRQAHLAEVFLGGLIYQPATRWNREQATDEIIYEFYEGVRNELVSKLPEHETVRVIYEVSRYIETRIGGAGEFAALLAVPAEGGAVKRLDPLSLRFATLSAEILRQFGRYQTSVEKLERLAGLAPKAAAQTAETVEVVEVLQRRLQELQQEYDAVVELIRNVEQSLPWVEPVNTDWDYRPPATVINSPELDRLLQERSRLEELIRKTTAELDAQLEDESRQSRAMIEDEKKKGSRLVAAARGQLGEDDIRQIASELEQMTPLEAMRLVSSANYEWDSDIFILYDDELPNFPLITNKPEDNPVTRLLRAAYERSRAAIPLSILAPDSTPEEIEEMRESMRSSARTPATEKMFVELEGLHHFNRAAAGLRDEFPDGTLFKDFSEEAVSIVDTLRDFIHPFIKLSEHLSTDISALSERYQSILSGKRLVVILYGVRDVEGVSLLKPPEGNAFIIIKTTAQAGTATADSMTSREDLTGPPQTAEPTEDDLRRRLQQLRQERNSVVLEIWREERLLWSMPENVEYRDDLPRYTEFDSRRLDSLLEERSRLEQQISSLQAQFGNEAGQARDVIEDEIEKGSRLVTAALGDLDELELSRLAAELEGMTAVEALRIVNSARYEWRGDHFIMINEHSHVATLEPKENLITKLLKKAYVRRSAAFGLKDRVGATFFADEIAKLKEEMLRIAQHSTTEKRFIELESPDKYTLILLAADELRSEFPDGMLFAEFNETSTTVEGALRTFIHPYIKLREEPLDGLSNLLPQYQSVLSDKRLLVILDGVRDVEDVRPLVPPVGNALIILKKAARAETTTEAETPSREALTRLLNDKIRELMSIAPRLRPAWELPMTRKDISDWRELEDQYSEVTREIGELERTLPQFAPDDDLIKRAVIDNRALPAESRSEIESYVDRFLDARLSEDKEAEASALSNLGQSFSHLQNHGTAVEFHKLALGRITQDSPQRFETLMGLANAYASMGQAQPGIELLEQEARASVKSDNKQFTAHLFIELAHLCSEEEDHRRALDYSTNALRYYTELEDRPGQARALRMMGYSFSMLGQWREAVGFLEQAAPICVELGDRHNAAWTMEKLSDAYEALGQRERALECAQTALNIYREFETPEAERLRLLLERFRRPRISTFEFETVTLDERGRVVRNGRRKLNARQFVEDLGDGVTLEMVEIPGGKFMMGAQKEETNSYGSERPQHEVTVSPFYIGKFTVTQKQWRIVAGWEKVERDLKPDPSFFKNRKAPDDHPVEQVSWEDAKEFCARLAKKSGRPYRLPSEAEWEYACRAGTTTPFAFGETITHETVNHDSGRPYAKVEARRSLDATIPVGSLSVANAFGLFDMHGNVWEWCEDLWHGDYNGAPTDGSAWLSGGSSSSRGLRGGSWGLNSSGCRSTARNSSPPDIRSFYFGFRVVVGALTLHG